MRYSPLMGGYIIYSYSVSHNFLIDNGFPVNNIEPVFDVEVENFDVELEIRYETSTRSSNPKFDISMFGRWLCNLNRIFCSILLHSFLLNTVRATQIRAHVWFSCFCIGKTPESSVSIYLIGSHRMQILLVLIIVSNRYNVYLLVSLPKLQFSLSESRHSFTNSKDRIFQAEICFCGIANTNFFIHSSCFWFSICSMGPETKKVIDRLGCKMRAASG